MQSKGERYADQRFDFVADDRTAVVIGDGSPVDVSVTRADHRVVCVAGRWLRCAPGQDGHGLAVWSLAGVSWAVTAWAPRPIAAYVRGWRARRTSPHARPMTAMAA